MTTDERLDLLEKLIREVSQQMAEIRSEVPKVRADLTEHRERLEWRMDLVVSAVQSFDMRVPGLTKAITDLHAQPRGWSDPPEWLVRGAQPKS